MEMQKRKINLTASLSVMMLAFGINVNAHAFGLGDITGGGGGGGGSSADTGKLVTTSKKMVKNYTIAMSSINYAQAEALEAFGLGDLAEKARQDAKTFKSGVVNGDGNDDKKIANTESRNKIIDKHAKKKTKLTGEARKHLAKSAATYAGASYVGVEIVKSLKDWMDGAQGAMKSMSSNPMKLVGFKKDVGPGLYVLSKLPDLASKWTSTSSALIGYAKINGDEIDSDKEKKKISASMDFE